MLNHPSLEAACVATYVEDYLDALESTANAMQPHISMIRRADVTTIRQFAF